ncbi:MAG: DUF853 family protein [Actinomycetota bacterium]|nr:DUF853 family protein [Actinomycetota bacterium]
MTPARPSRRPYWTLAAFALLLTLPFSWAVGVVAAAAVARVAWPVVRGARARRGKDVPEPGVTLGVGPRGQRVVLTDRQLSAHGLIVGASGAGKSTTLLTILSSQIERGRPVVVIDLKGSPSFARELGAAAQRAQRALRVWTPDGPSHWNPLAHGNATELKDKLVATERFTEPHYQRAAERYVQTALHVLLASGAQPDLGAVVALMEPRRLAAEVRHLQAPLAERVQDYLGALSPDQLSAVRGLGTRLALLSESQAGPFLGPGPGPMIDLRAALRSDDVVLFSLNSSRYGKLAAQLGTLAIQDLVSVSGQRLDEPGAPATVALDEFSALGADHVLQLLARGRESGLSVLVATQELSDLERAARGFRDQVLGLTAVKIAHRQDVPESAQTIAQMAGTRQEWEETLQMRGLFSGSGSRGSRRLVERYAVHPNEIKALAPGQAVILSKTPTASVKRVRVAAPARAARPSVDPSPTLDPATAAAARATVSQRLLAPPARARVKPPAVRAAVPRRRGTGRDDQAEPGVTR